MQDLGRRDFARLSLAMAAVTLMTGPGRAAEKAPAAIDPQLLRAVHPELRPSVIKFYSLIEDAARDPKAGAALGALLAPPATLADVPWREHLAPGPRGAPDVRVFVINAKPGPARPAILHIHGGGFTAGAAKGSILPMQKLAKTLDCVVVTVDYRLAPGTSWRGSVEDNYAGLSWLHADADRLGVDRSRIAVMGESAGGGHAALLAIAARDRSEIPLAFQCLTYPMLDDRTGTSRPVPPPIGQIAWTADKNRQGWHAFLGMEPGGSDVPVAAVPARTASLTGLPPAWIGVGGIDLFVDEDIEYAQRLTNSGVPTELDVVPGGFHGFDALPEGLGLRAAVSEQFNARKLNALRRAFGQAAV